MLSPTRELAIQTQEVAAEFAGSVGARSVCVYGGDPKHKQIADIKEGCNCIVATPGAPRTEQ